MASVVAVKGGAQATFEQLDIPAKLGFGDHFTFVDCLVRADVYPRTTNRQPDRRIAHSEVAGGVMIELTLGP